MLILTEIRWLFIYLCQMRLKKKQEKLLPQTKYLSYYSNGSLAGEIEYDHNGNETKKTAYNTDGLIKEKTEAEYDNTGKLQKVTNYKGDTLIASIEYEYKN